MSVYDGVLSGASVRKKSLTNIGLCLSLRFPYLTPTILILFTILVLAEYFFIQITILSLPFSMTSLCQYKTLKPKSYKSFILVTSFQTVTFLLFPVAGWLADAKYGRMKVINASIWLIWWSLLFLVISLLLYNCQQNDQIWQFIGFALFIVSLIGFMVGVAGFMPNILPFTIDQLAEASSSWVSSYVRWNAWSETLAISIAVLASVPYFGTLNSPPPISIFLLVLFAVHSILVMANIFCKTLYIQSQGYDDPYKTLFRIINFARKHKAPIRRSAMTYCERDIPSRLDLGKTKYGGPYSHESVENVKTFLRILVVFLSLSGYYYVASSSNYSVPYYFDNLHPPNATLGKIGHWVLFLNDAFIAIPLIPAIELVVHRFWPKLEFYLHKPFIWITVGFIILIVCSLCMMVATSTTTDSQNPTKCLSNFTADLSWQLRLAIIEIPSLLFGLSKILVFMSTLNFIVCQAPAAMRGMLLGLFLLTRSFIESVSNLFSLLFLQLHCQLWHWCSLTVIACASFLVYLIVAKMYRKRERQEIVNYRGMIESIVERDYTLRQRYKEQLQSEITPEVTTCTASLFSESM